MCVSKAVALFNKNPTLATLCPNLLPSAKPQT